MRRFEGNDEICDVSSDDVALITFTTGSSGQPKGITRTHGILTSQQEYLRSASYLHNDVDLATFPMFALNNMAWGIPSIIPPINLKKVAETDGAAVLKLMRKHGISTTTSSPPFYDRLADYHERHPDVPSHNLRRILVGGAPVSQAQLRRWSRIWPNTFIVVGYGSSECEPVAHIAAMERLWKKSKLRPEAPGICLGKIVPGVKSMVVGIVDGIIKETADCKVLGPGEIGELIIGGPHVVQEYYNNPEAVRKNKIKDSETGMQWHRMGDTGYLDNDGYFWITGRCHSTIYLGEGNVLHPQIVEQIVAGDGMLTEKGGCVLNTFAIASAILSLEGFFAFIFKHNLVSWILLTFPLCLHFHPQFCEYD